MINIVIPMAGLGSRFSDAGYKDPKPMIDVNGIPMIKAVVDSLNLNGQYIFIVQWEHFIKYNLGTFLEEIAPGCRIIAINGLTDGAAVTTLMAKHFIDNETPLIIANSDQIVEWDSDEFCKLLSAFDGVTAVFKSTDAKWSYVKSNLSLVSEVAEKIVISDDANVGIYGWSKGSNYIKYVEQMIQKNIKTNNEFYIAPVYNEAISDNKKITTYQIKKMYGIGTPEDLQKYLKGD